jgi:hypothetical protein
VEGRLPDPRRTRGHAPNGDIPRSVRLAIALRYFAGGNPLDLCSTYSVTRVVVYQSIWFVVEAINATQQLGITFPTSHEEQQQIAEGFKTKSTIGFDNCAGCIDGILVWIHKPSTQELDKLGIGGKKFFCGRKKNLD